MYTTLRLQCTTQQTAPTKRITLRLVVMGRLPHVSESDHVSDHGINKRKDINLLEINKKLTDCGLSMEDGGDIDDSLLYCASEDSNDSAYLV